MGYNAFRRHPPPVEEPYSLNLLRPEACQVAMDFVNSMFPLKEFPG